MPLLREKTLIRSENEFVAEKVQSPIGEDRVIFSLQESEKE